MATIVSHVSLGVVMLKVFPRLGFRIVVGGHPARRSSPGTAIQLDVSVLPQTDLINLGEIPTPIGRMTRSSQGTSHASSADTKTNGQRRKLGMPQHFQRRPWSFLQGLCHVTMAGPVFQMLIPKH